MKVKIKRLHEDAKIPAYAKAGDAGMDLTAVSCNYDDNNNIVYNTGLAFEIPEGYVGLLFPRSSNSKQDLLLSNSVGVVDSGYRGEVMLKFKIVSKKERGFVSQYLVGERVGQIVIIPIPFVTFEEADTLSDTDRGEGGYGSTGS